VDHGPEAVSARQIDVCELRELYVRGENIIAYLKVNPSALPNHFDPVMVSYDLQAGSYVQAMERRQVREHKERYARAICSLIAEYKPTSVLEAGVGEATTMRLVGEALGADTLGIEGFDISWSRLKVARGFVADSPAVAVRSSRLVCGDLTAIPYRDDSFDVVYTAHSIEPNRGHEREILRELYRVASRAVVLLEPGYELAGPKARVRMDQHGYVRDLPGHAEALGYRVAKHELLGIDINPLNPTAVTVIHKDRRAPAARPALACPISGSPLADVDGFLYSHRSLCAYPVLQGIPVLLRGVAILASRFGG
jgi:SAM-dependent methyltransferase